MPAFDPHLAARVLVDAQVMGDKKAAKKHHVTTRSIERYRVRMQSDATLHEMVAKKTERADEGLRPARIAFQHDAVLFMQKVVARGEELLPRASAKQFGEIAAAVKDVSEAVRNIGELDLAAELLGVGNRNRQPDPPTPEAGSTPADEGSKGDSNPKR